jgi:hypothetical protein
MSKSSHEGTGDFTQNQNNSMSEDPGDGGRKSFTTGGKGTGNQGAPDDQGSDRLAELGKKGSDQG